MPLAGEPMPFNKALCALQEMIGFDQFALRPEGCAKFTGHTVHCKGILRLLPSLDALAVSARRGRRGP